MQQFNATTTTVRSGVPVGFPAPGDKVNMGAPTQPVRSSIDTKSELGVKGRPKLTQAARIVVCRHV